MFYQWQKLTFSLAKGYFCGTIQVRLAEVWPMVSQMLCKTEAKMSILEFRIRRQKT
jgi:hypothetical protein